MKTACEYLSEILDVGPRTFLSLDKRMREACPNGAQALENVAEMNRKRAESALHKKNPGEMELTHVRAALRNTIPLHEKQFISILSKTAGNSDFERAANLARRISSAKSGFFLKINKAEEILRANPPTALLDFLGYASVDKLMANEDIAEILSALRFIEPQEWMLKTFDTAYSSISPDYFEERDIELKVLSEKWTDVGRKFTEKKHHNVSHLKEFGIIFLNPVKMNVPGKFIRDFALILHYFHEIEFYSKLFKKYAGQIDFAGKLKSLLRGDVSESENTAPGEWLIVQRYLWKENPKDHRLHLRRVNPEALHWTRGERDFASFALEFDDFDAELWHDLDWVGEVFKDADGTKKIVSFGLEDNVMSFVSFMEGRNEFFNYHQREAMWTKIFSEYVGGEQEMERMLLDNFGEGKVCFLKTSD